MMDCRQNVLTSINTLLRKMNFFQTHPDEKHIARFITSLITELELLRNDLILVFNQNFYLRCKLDEKTHQLQLTEKKLAEVTSRMNLTLEMSKHKYEKQIQALKFAHFIKREHQDGLPIDEYTQNNSQLLPAKALDLLKQNSEQQKIQQSTHQSSTIKKAKQFIQFKSSPPKEFALLGDYPEKKECVPEQEFDLQLRGGLLSEEKQIFSNNRVNQEMVRSNEMEEQHSKKRRGKATSTRKEDTNVLCHRKKKSEELAELVAQQFKVPPFKEKYFSTDLL